MNLCFYFEKLPILMVENILLHKVEEILEYQVIPDRKIS